jgi:anti-sigma factor RsiW
MTDPVTEWELMAYVDGQLDPERRIAVEEHLARHPQLAAQVMDDLRGAAELRLGLSEAAGGRPSGAVIELARRLRWRLRLRSWTVRLHRAAAAAVLVAAGWLAHMAFGGWGPDAASAAHRLPLHADEAAEAYRTVILEERLGPNSWPKEDPAVLAALAARSPGASVPLPDLAGEEALTPVGAHLLAWDGGNAVQVVYHDSEERPVALFAAEVDAFQVRPPRAEAVDGFTLVHWQEGWFGYAISGTGPRKRLLSLAERAWNR